LGFYEDQTPDRRIDFDTNAQQLQLLCGKSCDGI